MVKYVFKLKMLMQDEENQNLKEKYRAEIKKELQRIEAISGDMASLLRCLGIKVGGGSFPSQHEVTSFSFFIRHLVHCFP